MCYCYPVFSIAESYLLDATCARFVRERSISHAYRADTFQVVPDNGLKDADSSGLQPSITEVV